MSGEIVFDPVSALTLFDGWVINGADDPDRSAVAHGFNIGLMPMAKYAESTSGRRKPKGLIGRQPARAGARGGRRMSHRMAALC